MRWGECTRCKCTMKLILAASDNLSLSQPTVITHRKYKFSFVRFLVFSCIPTTRIRLFKTDYWYLIWNETIDMYISEFPTENWFCNVLQYESITKYGLFVFFSFAEACSSRSTPRPRPPTPAPRPNITFPTYKCPPAYAAYYCLNDARCFTVKIGDSLLYNCE